MEHLKALHFPSRTPRFIRSHWIGLLLILVATLVFFGPVLIRIGSYSEGGDAMFNAWTLARDQHCVLRQGCPSYVDGNIFFPHKDSMLYSETQLSTGVLSLPLYAINHNPIFSYNACMIASFFLMGFFMYLLAKHLSKGNELISVLAGLLFEFSPFRMPAISHLQNISIFYLPLAVLLILKFLEGRAKKRSYLIGLFIVLVLQFYASWYQMVFVLIALGLLLAGMAIFKLFDLKRIIYVFLIVCLAVITTLPLAKSYTNFSKMSSASFSIESQATYSSSVLDFVTPVKGTLLGDIYYKIRPHAHLNSYDTDSYSYYGLTLYVLAIGMLVFAYWRRKKGVEAQRTYKMLLIFAAIGIVGIIISLGPLLKIRNSTSYQFSTDGIKYVIALPYLLVDKFLPQLSFMRALGRAGVLLLFSLCCTLALVPAAAKKIPLYQRNKRLLTCVVIGLLIFELIPFHQEPMSPHSYSYNLSVPPVYKFIKNSKQVNNIIVLAADFDYPHAGIPTELPEETMWAGYDNKNTFNGYSGYLPPDYYPTYWNFLDFRPAVVPLLKKDGLHYVMVDKQLSTENPNLPTQVANVLGRDNIVYQDKRYVLFKVVY